MSAPLVSIVIPVWNRWDLTSQCLSSLSEHTPGNFYEVIVADNGSEDETATALPALGNALFEGRFHCIRLERNKGFGPACNAGADKATGQYILFLNNDTVLTSNWLPPLLKAFEREPRLGATGPLLLYPDSDRVQHCGIAFTPSLRTEHLYANFPADHPAITARRSLQAITGAAIMLPRTLFMECGGFHESYRNGSEDLELCCRIREKNKRLEVITKSRIYHLESQTPGRGDDDELNAHLLNQRCNGCFGPDLHRLAKRDGFRIALTPWLESYLTLPAEREEALTKESLQQFDPARCWETLQNEPLWQSGYAMLAAFLEENSRFDEAAGLRLLQTYFFPMLPHYQQLATTAARANNIPLAQQAVDKAEHVTGLLEAPSALTKKAAGLANWAKKAGEEDLRLMYEGWLKDLGLL